MEEGIDDALKSNCEEPKILKIIRLLEGDYRQAHKIASRINRQKTTHSEFWHGKTFQRQIVQETFDETSPTFNSDCL